MVQVDIVWSYTFGATLAASAARYAHGSKFFTSNVFMTLVGMAVFIAPALSIPIAL